MYVMSRDQRVRDNHALLAAQAEALERNVPLVVMFNLLTQTGYRRREHYRFMVDGLRQVKADLATLNIPFIKTTGVHNLQVATLATELCPSTIYFDFSPLRGPRAQQKKLARDVDCRVMVIDTHNIVPVWVTSGHEEYAAHTIRRKLHKLTGDWLVEPDNLVPHPHSLSSPLSGLAWDEIEQIVANVPTSGIDHGFVSGEAAASKRLQQFIETGLDRYAAERNDLSKDAQSDLSPYLHYGQVSSLRVVLNVMDSSDDLPQLLKTHTMPQSNDRGDSPGRTASIDAFVEEIVVRKELSDNFCFYQNKYDSLAGARDWAKKTLETHADDPREQTYTFEQLERGETVDELWNAAQHQLTRTGKIHGYMRMYWAKMLLAWAETPSRAIKTAIRLNDTYHLDGGDPNGYVGIMWSIAGVHDRPWFDRDVFGLIRFMSANGISKKFDTAAYIARWS